MKYIVLLLTSVLVQISADRQAFAQTLKVGFVDQQLVYSNMPEFQIFMKEIEASSAKYQDILKEKYDLYQQKIELYQKSVKDKAAEPILRDKATELENIKKSIEEFQMNSENDVRSAYQKKFTPVKNKVDKVIAEYGKENGYAYIFRLQIEEVIGESRPFLLYANDLNDDISKQIMLKLGITAPVKTTETELGLSRYLKK
jgi:outer membrane protein